MASDGSPGQISGASLVHGSNAATTASFQSSNGKLVPAGGSTAAAASSPATATPAAATATTANKVSQRNTTVQSQVASLNKFLNNSGRPDQYRVDPASNNTLIQQINPANGAVLEEFSVSEFPDLARSVGVSGLLVDDVA